MRRAHSCGSFYPDGTLLQSGVERGDSEVDLILVRHPRECFPRFHEPIAVHRIVSLLHDVPGQRQNLAGRLDAPPAAVQATETLPERIERCGLRH